MKNFIYCVMRCVSLCGVFQNTPPRSLAQALHLKLLIGFNTGREINNYLSENHSIVRFNPVSKSYLGLNPVSLVIFEISGQRRLGSLFA